MPDLLFVYGTLRQGNANAMAAYLAAHAEFVAGGWFQGQMYKISYYPGVVASNQSDDRVFGEVYRLSMMRKLHWPCWMITRGAVLSIRNLPNINALKHTFLPVMGVY